MPPAGDQREVVIHRAERLRQLPPYLFVEIDRRKREALKRGIDLVDLGIGDPDLPTPPEIVERLRDEALRPENHRYPSAGAVEAFSREAARWFGRRFGVDVDPGADVLPLIGTKEGLGHLPLAFVDPGDVVLVPDPAYPVYRAATLLAGGVPRDLPLVEERGFLPDLEQVDEDTWRGARVVFLNYPNNPTAAVADEGFYGAVVQKAAEYNVIVVNDAAYSEITFDGYSSPSLLQVDGAMDVGLEFHSFSKTYNMCGWRVGFAVGNERLISGLAALKANLDSHPFGAVLGAATRALQMGDDHIGRTLAVYRERRDILVGGLRGLGWDVHPPRGSFYLWVRTPEGMDSVRFATDLIERAGVVVAPGAGFGAAGEGYVRMSLTCETERVRLAVERLREAGLGNPGGRRAARAEEHHARGGEPGGPAG